MLTTRYTVEIRTIGLCVKNLARARAFYQQVFDFEPEPNVIEVDSQADGLIGLDNVDMTVHLLQKQGIKLELMECRNPPAVGGEERVLNRLGLTHMGFYVSDLDAGLGAITQMGGKIVESSRIEVDGKTLNIRVTDPEGNQTTLYVQ
jgi:predicted enzyme related to lactoylglutathione lyase